MSSLIAFDTNLLVRIATNDVPRERAIALSLLDAYRVFIPITVVLECEWVLRSRYDYKPLDFRDFMRYLASHGNVNLEKQELVLRALNAHENGCDFADALHALGSDNAVLYTLDKKLAKRSARLGLKVVAAQ